MREDRVVVLLARLVSSGFDARPGSGRASNKIVVWSSYSTKVAFARAAKLDRSIRVSKPAAGCYVLEFVTPDPDSSCVPPVST